MGLTVLDQILLADEVAHGAVGYDGSSRDKLHQATRGDLLLHLALKLGNAGKSYLVLYKRAVLVITDELAVWKEYLAELSGLQLILHIAIRGGQAQAVCLACFDRSGDQHLLRLRLKARHEKREVLRRQVLLARQRLRIGGDFGRFDLRGLPKDPAQNAGGTHGCVHTLRRADDAVV